MNGDADVPVIGSMLFSDGWRSETVRVHGRTAEVFISPDGERYVKAGDLQHADLIYHRVSRHFVQPLHLRLRFEEGSPLARKINREQRLAKRGEQLDNQRRKARRVRRKV